MNTLRSVLPYEPPSINAIMVAINDMGVKHPQLPQLRERAIVLAKNSHLAVNAIAYSFWQLLQEGVGVTALLSMDEKTLIEKALIVQREWYGNAPKFNTHVAE